jgi:hypothetical protein
LSNSYIISLGVFIAPCQQNNHCTPTLRKIHPVSRAVIDLQFRDTISNSFHISGISGSQALDSDLNSRSCPKVTQSVKPLSESLGFSHFDQEFVS